MLFIQISSMAIDTFSDFYAPIVQFHNGLFFSDSFLAKFISVGNFFVRTSKKSKRHRCFQVVELLLFAEVIMMYFACVYYRRGVRRYPRNLEKKQFHVFRLFSLLSADLASSGGNEIYCTGLFKCTA